MFVDSLFERLDTVTLYFSYHGVWEGVPYPNCRMKEGSVQCWRFSIRHGHSMIRHGWSGTSCSPSCVWTWQQCLQISRTVTGVHFVKHCDSSYLPSVLEAGDGQFRTGSCLIYSNDSESFLLNWIQLVYDSWWGTHPWQTCIFHNQSRQQTRRSDHMCALSSHANEVKVIRKTNSRVLTNLDFTHKPYG